MAEVESGLFAMRQQAGRNIRVVKVNTGSPVPALGPDDLISAAGICKHALSPMQSRDWSVRAGDLDWDCRRTLDHIADTLALYAGYLASQSRGRLPVMRDGDPDLPVDELLVVVETQAAVLVAVSRSTPSGARAFHPAGMADMSGYIAMACVEILIHTDDIASGLGCSFRPPDELCLRVLNRLFPWAPKGGDAWSTLRWACGRAALPDQERIGPDWYWHSAPLDEWDGTVKKRLAPPAWS